jgi:hypothetical protein
MEQIVSTTLLKHNQKIKIEIKKDWYY